MATSTQQKAKALSQQWWDTQSSKVPQYQASSDYNQNYVDTRGNQAYQQKKADYQQQYNQQLYDIRQNAQTSANYKARQNDADREVQLRQSDNSTYAQKKLADLEVKKYEMQGGSSSTAYGMSAAPASNTYMDEYGNSRIARGNPMADWQYKQGMVAANNKMFSEADAAGDVLRIKAQGLANGYAYNPGGFQYWGGRV